MHLVITYIPSNKLFHQPVLKFQSWYREGSLGGKKYLYILKLSEQFWHAKYMKVIYIKIVLQRIIIEFMLSRKEACCRSSIVTN